MVIFINQMNENWCMFKNPETTSGGNALKFYSSVRMDKKNWSDKRQRPNNWKYHR